MYLIVLEHEPHEHIFHIVSPAVYCIFVIDFIMQTYHEYHDEYTKKARFSKIFYAKVLIGILLGIDELLLGIGLNVNGRNIHPFYILRVCKTIMM